MPKAIASDFAERERDAVSMATASDAEIFDLCRSLGEDPEAVCKRIRSLLAGGTRLLPAVSQHSKQEVPLLPVPDDGLLPLRRILLVDDKPERMAGRRDEFRLHEFKLGFVVETATTGQEALEKLRNDLFDAVLIELGSPTDEDRQLLNKLRLWSTPLAPILLKSEGMEFLELRSLNRDAVRAIALGLGKQPPLPYRKKAAASINARKPCQSAFFDDTKEEMSGSN